MRMPQGPRSLFQLVERLTKVPRDIANIAIIKHTNQSLIPAQTGDVQQTRQSGVFELETES